MKGLGVAKVVREVGLEGVWAKLGSEAGFRMQSVKGYLGLALLFTWDSPGVVRCAWGGMLPLG